MCLEHSAFTTGRRKNVKRTTGEDRVSRLSSISQSIGQRGATHTAPVIGRRLTFSGLLLAVALVPVTATGQPAAHPLEIYGTVGLGPKP